jgi:hypothetical protein
VKEEGWKMKKQTKNKAEIWGRGWWGKRAPFSILMMS